MGQLPAVLWNSTTALNGFVTVEENSLLIDLGRDLLLLESQNVSHLLYKPTIFSR